MFLIPLYPEANVFSFFQTVYDEWFITVYNLMYTALPVLGLSLFDQVCTTLKVYSILRIYCIKNINTLLHVCPCSCRMWTTAGVSSSLSSTVPASSTCTSVKRPLCTAWCTAATAPSSSSSSPGPPWKTPWETTAKTSLTISPLLC